MTQINSARTCTRAGTRYNDGEQCNDVVILEGAVRWFRQIGDWWRRERFFTQVLRAMEAGVGVREATWQAGTPAEAVLVWFDDGTTVGHQLVDRAIWISSEPPKHVG